MTDELDLQLGLGRHFLVDPCRTEIEQLSGRDIAPDTPLSQPWVAGTK